ncbi:MAG: tetratricopeptide repeat protein [Spirochaetaceae bacterium]|nr:tetratricopeptide repeat protein [Spirochaetaceae bacterium]
MHENLLSEYFLVGDAYLENKKYDKAIEFYTKALEHPDLADSARYKIAYSYALAENWDKAIPAYKDLLAKDPENMELEKSLAYLYARQGNLAHSAATYRKLTEKNPYDQALLENFITVLIAGNYLEEAEVALDRLKTDFPENTTAGELEKQLTTGWEALEGKPPVPLEDEKQVDESTEGEEASPAAEETDGESVSPQSTHG